MMHVVTRDHLEYKNNKPQTKSGLGWLYCEAMTVYQTVWFVETLPLLLALCRR